MEDLLPPKEKAKQLMGLFDNVTIYIDMEPTNIEIPIKSVSLYKYTTKELALIMVKEIKKANPCEVVYGKHSVEYSPIGFYWDDVEKEINNL